MRETKSLPSRERGLKFASMESFQAKATCRSPRGSED